MTPSPNEVERLADAATREIHGDDYRIATRLVIERAIREALREADPSSLSEFVHASAEVKERIGMKVVDGAIEAQTKAVPHNFPEIEPREKCSVCGAFGPDRAFEKHCSNAKCPAGTTPANAQGEGREEPIKSRSSDLWFWADAPGYPDCVAVIKKSDYDALAAELERVKGERDELCAEIEEVRGIYSRAAKARAEKIIELESQLTENKNINVESLKAHRQRAELCESASLPREVLIDILDIAGQLQQRAERAESSAMAHAEAGTLFKQRATAAEAGWKNERLLSRLNQKRAEDAEASVERLREWLDNNTTFYDVDADFPVESKNIPVLAAVSERIWYHATDDIKSYPFSAVIDAAPIARSRDE